MEFLSGLFNSIQNWLLPCLEEEFGELTARQTEFVRAVELINPLEFIEKYDWDVLLPPEKLNVNVLF